MDFKNAFIVKVVLSFHNPLRMPNIEHFDAVDTVKFCPVGLVPRSKCSWLTSILNVFISSGPRQKKYMCVCVFFWGGGGGRVQKVSFSTSCNTTYCSQYGD